MAQLKLPHEFKEPMEEDGNEVNELVDKITDILHEKNISVSMLALSICQAIMLLHVEKEDRQVFLEMALSALAVNMDNEVISGDSMH